MNVLQKFRSHQIVICQVLSEILNFSSILHLYRIFIENRLLFYNPD